MTSPPRRWLSLALVWLCLCTTRVEAQPVTLTHAEVMRMISTPEVTATTSGDFSDPATWGGKTLAGNATLSIPAGVTVTVSRDVTTRYDWIRVDGTLRFRPDANTTLVVGTIVVMGKLEIGTESTPIQPHVTARLVFKSNGLPFNHDEDPLELMRGLIAMSPVHIEGAPKREICALAGLPAAGATLVTPECDPVGLRVGDEMLVAPTLWGQDEVVAVTGIAGRVVTFAPALKHSRQNVPNDPSLRVHVGNLTRNVVIESDAADKGSPQRQGHVMLMGGGHVVKNAAFLDTGRTIVRDYVRGKAMPVTDPILVTNPDGSVTRDPQLMPLCDMDEENVRGRYSLHFHNAGPASAASVVEGVVIRVQREKGFKIGLQNHSSHVLVRRTITHQIDGSGFFAEEGDERGEFVDSMAIHSRGSNAMAELPRESCANNTYPLIHHRRRADWGHHGSGLWLQHSGNVLVKNFIAAGHAAAGINSVSKGLGDRKNNTFTVKIRPDHLRDGYGWVTARYGAIDPTLPLLDIPDPPLTIDGADLYAIGGPVRGGGAGFSFETGLETAKLAPERPRNIFRNMRVWNVSAGITSSYTSWLLVENAVLISGQSLVDLGRGISTAAQNGKHGRFRNVTVEGFKVGEEMRPGPSSYFDNVTLNGKPYVPTVEACGDLIDNDGDGAINEECITETNIPPPPADTDPPVLSASASTPTSLAYTLIITGQDFYQGQLAPGDVLIDVFIDGALNKRDCKAPCTVLYDLVTLGPGSHVISAIGRDAASNVTAQPFTRTVP